MKIFNLSDFASLYFGNVDSLNLSLDLDYETWQKLNATAHALLEGDLIGNYNSSDTTDSESMYMIVPITIIYVIIFIAGIIGNISTCIVIVQNKCMHTATNYYLFSLAISDLILLLSGLPPEVFRVWNPHEYIFGEASCVFLGLASETSANATVLTITAFTVERYIAICHPFISHTMSKLSRVIKFIIAIWLLALCLAIPQAIQYGVVYTILANRRQESICTVKWEMVEHAFEISGFVFFVGPMTVITVLYLLIGFKLRTSRLLQSSKKGSFSSHTEQSGSARSYKQNVSQSRAIKMLVAVAVSFFLCWAPFHSQRLLAVYGKNADEPSQTLLHVYLILTDLSGVLYFLSTAINPFLYNIMSNKFREAFRTTIAYRCCGRSRHIRRTTRCDKRSRPPSLKRKRKRLPSTNTHLSNLTCVSKNIQNEGQTLSNNKQKYNRSVSAVLIRSDIARNSKSVKENQCMVSSTAIRNNNNQRFKLIKGKIKMGTMAMFNAKDNTVSIAHNQEEKEDIRPVERQRTQTLTVELNRRDSSESEKSSISNSSLQDLDEDEYTGKELATFMERVNHNIL